DRPDWSFLPGEEAQALQGPRRRRLIQQGPEGGHGGPVPAFGGDGKSILPDSDGREGQAQGRPPPPYRPAPVGAPPCPRPGDRVVRAHLDGRARWTTPAQQAVQENARAAPAIAIHDEAR